jgi:hypothetical protein
MGAEALVGSWPIRLYLCGRNQGSVYRRQPARRGRLMLCLPRRADSKSGGERSSREMLFQAPAYFGTEAFCIDGVRRATIT